MQGLYKDAEHLHWNSSDSVINNRQWRTSDVSPFAANVAFVLYNCSGTEDKLAALQYSLHCRTVSSAFATQ